MLMATLYVGYVELERKQPTVLNRFQQNFALTMSTRPKNDALEGT